MTRIPLHPAPEPLDTSPGPCNRRDLLRQGVCACLGAGLATDIACFCHFSRYDPADERPQPGDWLVDANAEGPPRPLRVEDIPQAAKPLQALAMDGTTKVVRDGSRLNKLVLIRLDTAGFDDSTRARSAQGVLAYSGVCTHQGCDVTEWVDTDRTLMCFCHFSRYDPANDGQVLAGPAPRSLPALPLTEKAGVLAVAGPFTTSPGAKTAG